MYSNLHYYYQNRMNPQLFLIKEILQNLEQNLEE
nr:MAG TPA: hypothetical protein [Caudoviricetes sp.]